MKQHKWHKEIKAWADGAEIEFRLPTGTWKQCCFDEPPQWLENIQYRIKPQLKEQQYLSVEITETGFTFNCEPLFKAGVLGKYKIKLEPEYE